MHRWRFALERRWFGYLAVAILFAIACYFLSQWQFARRDETLAEVAKVEQNYDAAPQPLTAVMTDMDSFDEDQEWSPVEMTGTYLTEDQLLVRSRPYGGRPGFEVLTPLRLDDGSIFIVDRGWVPTGEEQDSPDFVPEAPSGTVTVTARLKPGEPNLPGRSAPAGQVSTINLPTVAGLVGGSVYTGAYGLLDSEDPLPADTRPFAAIKPDVDEGPHLSYAFQWLVFALFGFFGLGYALRTEYRHLNADDPEEMARAEERERKARLRPRSDDEIEDSILDAHR